MEGDDPPRDTFPEYELPRDIVLGQEDPQGGARRFPVLTNKEQIGQVPGLPGTLFCYERWETGTVSLYIYKDGRIRINGLRSVRWPSQAPEDTVCSYCGYTFTLEADAIVVRKNPILPFPNDSYK